MLTDTLSSSYRQILGTKIINRRVKVISVMRELNIMQMHCKVADTWITPSVSSKCMTASHQTVLLHNDCYILWLSMQIISLYTTQAAEVTDRTLLTSAASLCVYVTAVIYRRLIFCFHWTLHNISYWSCKSRNRYCVCYYYRNNQLLYFYGTIRDTLSLCCTLYAMCRHQNW